MRVLALLPFLGLTAAHSVSPVERVVTLIKSLKAKIEADGDDEQKLYDKSACWFENVFKRKNQAISDAKALLAVLEQRINKHSGNAAEQGATVKQLNSDIADNKKSVAEAKALREKEHDDYQKLKYDTEQALQALGRATRVLAGAGMGKKTSNLLTVAADLKSVMGVTARATLTSAERRLMDNFLAHPMQFAQESATFVEDYAPQSTGIQGILKDMYDNSAVNLETAGQAEADSQRAHESYLAEKAAELAQYEENLESAETSLAHSEKVLNDSKLESKKTKEQLKLDEVFLAETTKQSKARAEEWAERTRLRTEELNGIAEAIKILKSGGKTFGFDEPTSFLQTGHSSVFQVLSKAAKHTHSLRLAQLAAEAKVLRSGHFDVILRKIDQLIQALRDEEAGDIKDKDACQDQQTLNGARTTSLEADKTKLSNKLDTLESEATDLSTQVDKVAEAIVKEQKAKTDKKDLRNEDHEAYIAFRKDSQKGISLLNKAIKALLKFYQKNKLGMAMAQEDPSDKYTYDQDKAPEGFKKSYGGRKGESRGIVAILTLIRDDMVKQLKKAEGQESEQVAEYRSFVQETNDSIDSMNDNKRSLKGQLAQNEEDQGNTDLEHKTASAEADATSKAAEDLKPSCNWIETSFESRRTKRAAELKGLFQAKEVLASHESMKQDLVPTVPGLDAADIGF